MSQIVYTLEINWPEDDYDFGEYMSELDVCNGFSIEIERLLKPYQQYLIDSDENCETAEGDYACDVYHFNSPNPPMELLPQLDALYRKWYAIALVEIERQKAQEAEEEEEEEENETGD